MAHQIYLDNNATTQLDPNVLQAMLQELQGPPANPSSIHELGQRAKQLLRASREKVARFFGVKPEEILFTSGGTEAINYFLRGLKGHVVSTKIEHSAIFHTLQLKEDVRVSYVPVGLFGAPMPEDIERAILPETCAIVLSACNSETGVKIDLPRIAAIAEAKGIPLFIDAVAYIGKEYLTLHPGITAVAMSAHKLHGPKGVGALYLKGGFKLPSLLTGGPQEQMRRAGTENLAGILGFAQALQIVSNTQEQITSHLSHLQARLEAGLKANIPDLIVHGTGPRICNTSNLAFPDVDGETLLMQLDLAGIRASHGSACNSGHVEPSRILTEMGITRKEARSSIRLSLSRMNTVEEVDCAIETISQVVAKLREISSISSCR